MKLIPTPLPGVFTVKSPPHQDARGSFQRGWCAESFTAAGLDFVPRQASISTNPHLHTLRGLHWQDPPFAEQKLVRCVSGTIWDVVVDLKSGCWYGARLEVGGDALFLPRGVAHGFLTLTPGAVVEYLIDTPHQPDAAKGARWNDPSFAIEWPAEPALISDRDQNWPDFQHG